MLKGLSKCPNNVPNLLTPPRVETYALITPVAHSGKKSQVSALRLVECHPIVTGQLKSFTFLY